MMTMTPQHALRAVRLALLALALGAGGLMAGTLHAQVEPPRNPARGDLPEPGDGFTWEQVGDRGLDARGLAFGSDSTLWATTSRGVYRLDTTGGFPGAWVHINDSAVLSGSVLVLGQDALGRDTLLVSRGSMRRSVDGGVTWEIVHDRGGGGLYEIPAGYPHAGRILTSAADGLAASIAYSDDRGATFTEGVVPGPGGNYADAADFVALPPGSPYAGRILAAGRWGVNVSDDGGETFRESGLWQAVYYVGHAVDVVERVGLLTSGISDGQGPGDEVGAVMGGRVSGQADARAWSSADGGETWEPGGGGHRLPEGPPNDGSLRAVLSLGGSSVLVVLRGGTVYRTDDAGATWGPVGRAPEISSVPSVYVTSAVLGPDRRLYVGLQDNSAEEGWVWRTAETHEPPPPVSSEPEPPSGEPLGVEVRPNPFRHEATVTLTLPEGGVVAVAAYDVLGRRVASLASGLLGAGEHEFPLSGASLPPGVYVVRVTALTVSSARAEPRGGAERGGAVVSRTVTVLR